MERLSEKSDLSVFKKLYDISKTAYQDEREIFKKRENQYKGSREVDKGKDVEIVYPFTRELIESQIDNSIPFPNVTPRVPTDENLELARVIEDMLRNELSRLPMEYLNDEDERNVKIFGGDCFQVSWDNTKKTPDYVGALNIQIRDAYKIIPQESVTYIHEMDYIFVVFDETIERLCKMFPDKKDSLQDEGTDEHGEQNLTGNIVTQKICYYINGDGGLGCRSWVGDTELINDEYYEARKTEECEKCGREKAYVESKCACGSKKFKKRNNDFEELETDILDADGNVLVPAVSPKLDADGNVVMEEYDTGIQAIEGGVPMFDRVFDEQMNVVGETPITMKDIRPVMQKTKVPFYYPHILPLAIRKNVSNRGKFFGDSDCDPIRDHQIMVNQVLTKMRTKILRAGSYLTQPSDLDFTMTDEDARVLKVENPTQMSMLQAIDMKFNTADDMNIINFLYSEAKSILGITDSAQGKADTTAISGVAKQIQVDRTEGRLESKRKMKKAFYEELFEIMFKFMLAYADEPREYASKNEAGDPVTRVFDRYMFLKQSENGEWYFNDEFNFSIDENIDVRNRQFQMEDLRTDFGIGAYGDKSDPRTLELYWRMKEKMNYPNAKAMRRHFTDIVEQLNSEESQQQQMQMEQMAQQLELIGGENENLKLQTQQYSSENEKLASEVQKYLGGRNGFNQQ